MARIRLAQSVSADLESGVMMLAPITPDMPMTISAGLYNRGGDQHRRVNCASHSLAEVFPSLWHIV